MVINFKRPVRLSSVYLKKHRDSEYWKQEVQENFNVSAQLNDEIVLQTEILAGNLFWK